jgi:hypothetical protein
MSHFTVVAIVKNPSLIFAKTDEDLEKVEAEVEKIMAPYDEGLEVPEYEEECYCVGCKARNEVGEEVNVVMGTISDARDAFELRHADLVNQRRELEKKVFIGIGEESKFTKTEIEEANNEYDKIEDIMDTLWKDEVIKHRREMEAELLSKRDDVKAPKADCEECHGTGKRKSTYNPKSKWDWFSFGGRWNGCLTDHYEGSDDGFNFSDKFRQSENNLARVEDISESFIPFAMVTPDGEWHEKGHMGWWAMVSDKTENWDEVAKELLNKYKDGNHIAVLLDAHI